MRVDDREKTVSGAVNGANAASSGPGWNLVNIGAGVYILRVQGYKILSGQVTPGTAGQWYSTLIANADGSAQINTYSNVNAATNISFSFSVACRKL
jgi:hypothetical protein